jgi:hypothetical protein
MVCSFKKDQSLPLRHVTVIINAQPEGKGPLGKTSQTGGDITTDLKKI